MPTLVKLMMLGAFTFVLEAGAQILPDRLYPESLTVAQDGTMSTGSTTESTIMQITPDSSAAEAFIKRSAGGLVPVQGLLADEKSERLYSLSNLNENRSDIVLPTNAAYPNGIARASDGTIYVGLITDGRIWRRAPNGDWSTLFHGSSEVFAATSLRLDETRGLLWGTSPDFLPQGRPPRTHRIFAIDIGTGQLRHSLAVPNSGFPNDMVIEGDGAVLVTDSFRSRVLRIDPDTLEATVYLDNPSLAPVGGIGAAGIAQAPDRRLVVGNYGSGRLYIVEAGTLRELMLPRLLENPDGLAFSPDGSLIVLEGAVESGNGRILRIPDPFSTGRRHIEVLAHGLESPVNITVSPDKTAFITESRIRHRLIAGREKETPKTFRVIKMPLP